MNGPYTPLFAALVAAVLGAPGPALAASSTPAVPNAARPTAWQPVAPKDVRAQLVTWLNQAHVAADTRAKVLLLWSENDASLAQADLPQRLAESFALIDPRAAALVQQCARPHAPGALPKQDWLADPQTSPLVGHNMRLYYGRWLAQSSLFDAAQEQLAGLEPADVADPATLLFYQGVVCHRLLDRQQGLRAIGRLLENPNNCPRRYAAVAKLMEQDLKELKEDTLDHISRRMDDIRRRLDLGHGGPKVREVQSGVIKSLDKLIKDIEDQQQQMQQQASMGAGSRQSSSPAPDSRILGGKGPGDVVKRNIGQKSGWGNISPKQREEAIQQIGRDFPPHYRELIEQYFRQLANEGSE